MARVLSLSSQVVRGHVGNSAAVFAMQRLGHEVWALPTVVLSNHPGHAHLAGTRIAPETLREMVGALEGNGWLGEVDAVLTGYLPSAEHVAFAAATIRTVRGQGRKPLVLVDPVIGDDPGGLYVAKEAAEAVRDILMPLADILTPNRFELAWLARCDVTSQQSACEAAAKLNLIHVLATSIPGPDGQSLLNVLWQPGGTGTAGVPHLASVPHGTGDLLAALHLAHMLHGKPPAHAMRLAVAGVAAAISTSAGSNELRLIASQDKWGGGTE